MILRSVKVRGYLYIFGIGRINVFSMIISCYFYSSLVQQLYTKSVLTFFS